VIFSSLLPWENLEDTSAHHFNLTTGAPDVATWSAAGGRARNLSGCQSLRVLERFAIRHHSVLTEALGLELRRPPSDSSFRYFFQQVDVAALCTAIRDWTIAQIPGGGADLDQLVCDGKTLRGSPEATAGGGSAFIAQVSLYSSALGVAYCFAEA
jgi:hypothetical protein